MSWVRRRAEAVAFVLLSVGLGLGGGAIFTDARAAADNAPAPVFGTSGLLPGETLTGHLDIPEGNQPLTPYAQALNLRDGCVAGDACPPSGPLLSNTLQLAITAPNGQSWQGTPADLATVTALPGTLIPAGSGSVQYRISLTVPVTLVNTSEDRTIALELQWGSMDNSNQIITSVLGETFTKGGNAGTSSGSSASHGTLPFTGSYVGLELLIGAGLVGTGAVFWLAAIRRRRQAR